jgi:hypothetical protein
MMMGFRSGLLKGEEPRREGRGGEEGSLEQVVLFGSPERLRLIKWEGTCVQIALDFPEDCRQLSSALT